MLRVVGEALHGEDVEAVTVQVEGMSYVPLSSFINQEDVHNLIETKLNDVMTLAVVIFIAMLVFLNGLLIAYHLFVNALRLGEEWA